MADKMTLEELTEAAKNIYRYYSTYYVDKLDVLERINSELNTLNLSEMEKNCIQMVLDS